MRSLSTIRLPQPKVFPTRATTGAGYDVVRVGNVVVARKGRTVYSSHAYGDCTGDRVFSLASASEQRHSYLEALCRLGYFTEEEFAAWKDTRNLARIKQEVESNRRSLDASLQRLAAAKKKARS